MGVRRIARSEVVASSKKVKHGEYTTYTNNRCRCAKCRKANSDYLNRRKLERAELLKKDPSLAEHGKPSTYGNWMCRCDDCTEAWREARHRDAVRRRSEKAKMATQAPKTASTAKVTAQKTTAKTKPATKAKGISTSAKSTKKVSAQSTTPSRTRSKTVASR